MKKCIISAIIGLVLIIGTGGFVSAQTPAFPVLNEYFVNVHGHVVGPHGADGLRQLILQGQMTRDSFVWAYGMPTWALAGTVVELAPLFAGLPPPLPGTAPPVHHPPQTWGQPAQQAVHGEPWGGHPVAAGLVNTIFGIWSFTNDDFQGGLMTAGIQVGGILASIIAPGLFIGTGNWTAAQMTRLAGSVVYVGGLVYSFHRGFTQFNAKTAAARSFAEAVNSNPMNNISLVAMPTFDDRRFVGSLTYSLSF